MSYFDLAILGIAGFFSLYGFWKGLVRMIMSAIAMVVGFLVAYLFNGEVADYLQKFLPWSQTVRKNLAFVLLLIIANRLVGLVFWFVDKIVGFIWRFPFINSLNRMLGLVLGFLESIVVLGVLLAFLFGNPSGAWLEQRLGASKISPLLIKLGSGFLPGVESAIGRAASGAGYAK